MSNDSNKLGTFLGVFTPTILTILGVIMYLRFGWLLGNLGLSRVLLVVVVANSITLVTALSFSAVATNAKIGGGGAYFIISRSLGSGLGGAIGIPLFLSQAFSVTLYAYGLAESFRFVAPGLPLLPVTLGLIVAVGLLAVAGADKALRSQVALMAFVGLSLLALAIGAFLKAGDVPRSVIEPGSLSFWAGFAVFFPAVTGVMAGLGLSGDLRDPMKSLPRGSLLAVGIGFLVYMTIPFLLNMGADGELLREDTLVWTRIAWAGPWLILPGLWAAIFSSAVGSILAAPRTLQALARDGLAPSIFWQPQAGRGGGLVAGLVVSVLIALSAAFLGALNIVASVVSMFFLTVYGTVNLVTAFESLSRDPSWRPKIRIHWSLSLAGGLACFGVMVLINPWVGMAAIAAEIGLYVLISRRSRKARWGDARRGLYESLIRWSLFRLAGTPKSSRNWRPHILAFVDDPKREIDLVRFANAFSQGRGVVTACHLLEGGVDEFAEGLSEMKGAMQASFHEENLPVFAQVSLVNNILDGILSVAQTNGIAGMESNTVFLGWPRDPHLRSEFLGVTRRLGKMKKSVVLGRFNESYAFSRSAKRRILVWWGGLDFNSDLMLLLAYLLKANHEWRDAAIELVSVASNETVMKTTEANFEKLIPEFRIEVSHRTLLKPDRETVGQLIQRESEGADIVFLGMMKTQEGGEAEYAERMETLAGELPVVFFVMNSSLFTGELLDSPVEEFEDAAAEGEKSGEESAKN
ncbi:Na-K-Cl cotransporter [bacterium]|nr:Na-K-Cl cotransporter [bacterium]